MLMATPEFPTDNEFFLITLIVVLAFGLIISIIFKADK